MSEQIIRGIKKEIYECGLPKAMIESALLGKPRA